MKLFRFQPTAEERRRSKSQWISMWPLRHINRFSSWKHSTINSKRIWRCWLRKRKTVTRKSQSKWNVLIFVSVWFQNLSTTKFDLVFRHWWRNREKFVFEVTKINSIFRFRTTHIYSESLWTKRFNEWEESNKIRDFCRGRFVDVWNFSVAERMSDRIRFSSSWFFVLA